ncbi:MAG: hypothetical protein FXF54_00240 [Kosmotoga sp.]|nr:MAG: hypothetical protein FXF54_00240 [Kosmotoga sp.]
MKYIFIDTNNFLYCSLQTKEKHTPDTLIKLKEILNGNEKVILLLPEVIELEYYKVVEDSFVNNIQNQLGKVKGFINENSDFPEHLVKPVEEKLDRIKQEKRKSKKDAIEVFEKIKGHKNTQSILKRGRVFTFIQSFNLS